MGKNQAWTCIHCGHGSPRRLGRCPACGEWNSFEAEPAAPVDPGSWLSVRERSRPIGEIPEGVAERMQTGSREFDRVLGGGLVRGATVLVGGDPGVGKSTLVLQAADRLARAGANVLYLSAEESGPQVRMRGRRLGAEAASLFVGNGSNLLDFSADIAARSPDVVVVDSIQTVSLPDLPGVPGSLVQVRECAARLTATAKAAGFALILIGHVTKEGTVAGPRTLEHLVDAVLYIEGDRMQDCRLLRAAKNRFGSTGELGIFSMTSRGLADVLNPSKFFADRTGAEGPGSVVTPALVGTRTLLVDVQALTARAGYGTPARRATGVDPTRLAVLLAVLEKRAGLSLQSDDVFVATGGGARLDDPSSDLAVALAVASARTDRPFPASSAAVGEIGLGGEIRPCGLLDSRLDEAARLGLRRILVPFPAPASTRSVELVPVRDIAEALRHLDHAA